jgi:hypothetical protein
MGSEPADAGAGRLLIARRTRQLPRLHPVKQPPQRVNDLRNGLPERLAVAGADIDRCHLSLFKEGVEIRQPGTHPVKRSGFQSLDEATRARFPPRKAG